MTSKKRKHHADSQEPLNEKKKRKRKDAPHEQPTTSTPIEGAEVSAKRREKRSKSQPQPLVNGPSRELVNMNSQESSSHDAVVSTAEDDPLSSVEETAIIPGELEHLLDSSSPSPFYSTRLSLYTSIPAISLATATSSLLSTHLAPLLLTYFPPAQGIVLAFSDPVLSAKPDTGINIPLVAPSDGAVTVAFERETFARSSDEFGVCWVWLTATLLVFRVERGDEIYGWTNVTSEGFVGLVSYNYFQTAVGKSRIPQDWQWNGPVRESTKPRKQGKKGRLREDGRFDDSQESAPRQSQEPQEGTGHAALGDDAGVFLDGTGSKINETLKFRVVDTEMAPATERDKWTLQIDGTLLDEEDEQRVLEEERARFERTQLRSRSKTPGTDMAGGDVLMSGGLTLSREGSVTSRMSGHAASWRS